jgi:hypothetical protein
MPGRHQLVLLLSMAICLLGGQAMLRIDLRVVGRAALLPKICWFNVLRVVGRAALLPKACVTQVEPARVMHFAPLTSQGNWLR